MRHFDLCVIGSGSGNSIVDESFAEWSVAIVDDGARFGGTCLNAGCIPSKMFVYPADVVRQAQQAARVDVDPTAPGMDWAALGHRVFGRTDAISESGEDWRRRGDNVTLFRKTARFLDDSTLQLGDEVVTADQVVLANGSRPNRPSWSTDLDPDIADRVHTSDDVMRLAKRPASLVVVGAGFVAAELAHVFSAAGTQVTVLARHGAMLRREDADLSRRFTEEFAENVTLRLGHSVKAVDRSARGLLAVLTTDVDGVEYSFEAERVLLAVGRAPNSDTLGLANTGVRVAQDGYVEVDAHQRTSVPHVWALGDVCSRWQLKHVANHEARVVQHNLLHPDNLMEADHRFPPHAVFSFPQVAVVGLTEQQARDAGIDVAVKIQAYGDVAYGWAMNDDRHFVKLIADRATKQLVGAHLMGPAASILVQPIIQAMSFGLDVPTMARGQYWIHPALSEVVENGLLGLDLD